MEVTIPHYYKKFQCIASDCPDTCCAGWAIMIDDKALKKYKNIKGPFGNRVHNSIDWKEHSFRQYEGRCAFLNEENLCDLYLEGGKDYFCKTCRNYPRHIEEFEDCREISLSLSCIAAARIVLGSQEKVRFLTREIETRRQEDYGDFDYFLFSNLLDVREALFGILQNRNMKAGTRICMALALVHDFQGRIQRQSLYETQELLARYQKPSAGCWFEKDVESYRSKEYKEKAYQMFRVLFSMETLQKNWPQELRNAENLLYAHKEKEYGSLQERFQNDCKESGLDLEILREQLMVYFVFTYFAGAVYDGQAFGKMKLAVAATFLTEELAMACWKEQGEKLSLEDYIWVAHSFSREIEHSDLNLNRLETEMKAFQLQDFFVQFARK